MAHKQINNNSIFSPAVWISKKHTKTNNLRYAQDRIGKWSNFLLVVCVLYALPPKIKEEKKNSKTINRHLWSKQPLQRTTPQVRECGLATATVRAVGAVYVCAVCVLAWVFTPDVHVRKVLVPARAAHSQYRSCAWHAVWSVCTARLAARYIYACASAKRKSSFSLPSKVLINGRAGGILYSTPMIDRVDWNRSQRVRPTQWRNVAAKLESQHNAKLLLSRCCCRFIVVVWKLHYVIDNWRTVIIVDRINDQTDFNLRRSAFHRRPRPLLACITDIARRTYERYICWNRANGRLRH